MDINEISEAASKHVAMVAVLNAETEQGATSIGNSAQAQINTGDFPVDAVIHISATGTSTYKGATMNAGIRLIVEIDGNDMAQDMSFEGESSSISFFASAAHVSFLKRKTPISITARVEPVGGGGTSNKHTNVRLNVVALAARKVD